MELLDRYLQAVRYSLFLVPRAQKDDILKELSENLRSQVEDKEAEVGRPLNDGELEAMLKQHGHPLVVAGRCRQNQRRLVVGREVIGPELFPLYELIVLFNATLATIIASLVVVILQKPVTLGTLLFPAFIQVLIVTTIFAIANRYVRSTLLDQWDPHSLPHLGVKKTESKAIPRSGSLLELAFAPILLGFWADLPGILPAGWTPFTPFGDGKGVPSAWGPVWQDFHETFYMPVLLALVAGVAVSCVNLLRPYWTRPRLGIRGAINISIALMLGVVLAEHATELQALWVKMTNARPKVTEAEAVSGWTNLGVSMAMLVVSIIALCQGMVEVVRTIRWRVNHPSVTPGMAALAIVMAMIARPWDKIPRSYVAGAEPRDRVDKPASRSIPAHDASAACSERSSSST